MKLYTQDLDHMAAHGCKMPDCDHKDHDGTVYLHSKCHLDAGMKIGFDSKSNELWITCGRCEQPVAVVQTTGEEHVAVPPDTHEHATELVEIRYQINTGYLEMRCLTCKTPLVRIGVARHA